MLIYFTFGDYVNIWNSLGTGNHKLFAANTNLSCIGNWEPGTSEAEGIPKNTLRRDCVFYQLYV